MAIFNNAWTPYLKDWKNQQILYFRWNLNLRMRNINIPLTVNINKFDLFTFILASLPAIYYLHTFNWFLNNFFGIILTYQAIRQLTLNNFEVAFKLLAGFILYDSFWIYATDVMLSVASTV